MKKMIIGLLATIVMPMMLQAGGMGLYIPYSISHEVDGTSSPDDDLPDSDYDFTFKDKAGIGLAYVTNLGKDKMFAYQFGFEYTQPQGEYSSISADKIDLINTLEFGVLNTKVVKLWIGPRINIGYKWYESSGYKRTGLEFGIAPAAGININIGRFFALTFDVDYKFAAGFGSFSGAYDGVYTEQVKGATARFGVYLKFGESHQEELYN